MAFVEERYGQRYVLEERGQLRPRARFWLSRRRQAHRQQAPGGFLETRDGTWVAEPSARILQPRDSFPSFATGDRKWIDISINDQSLVAYVGKQPGLRDAGQHAAAAGWATRKKPKPRSAAPS